MAGLLRAGAVGVAVLGSLASVACGESGLTGGEPHRVASLRSAAGGAATHPTGVVVRSGVVYRTAAGVRLRLDEYLPAAGPPHPAVIFVHGGGFRSGERGAFAPGEQAFAATGRTLAREGFATVAIDYRLAPRFSFPAAEQDVLAAIRWVRRNAHGIGVDPARIGLFGASAGGNLAALAATQPTGPLDRGERVRVAVSWSGPMDLARYYPGHEFVGEYLGCAPAACPARYRAASPVTYVDNADPPTLLVNATAESVPIAQARVMDQRLRTARVAHELLQIPGRRHAGQYAQDALPATLRFLRQHLTP